VQTKASSSGEEAENLISPEKREGETAGGKRQAGTSTDDSCFFPAFFLCHPPRSLLPSFLPFFLPALLPYRCSRSSPG